MKKIAFIMLCAAMMLPVYATEIWSGSQHVSWEDGGLQIPAAQFAEAAPGQKILVSFAQGATDAIEFKVLNANFDHLAGSRDGAWINDAPHYEQFLIQPAVDSLKKHGLELIGANFTVTKVELLDGKTLKEGITVWTGFFWVDDDGGWKTLELYFNGYAGVDWDKATALRIYTEAKGQDYIINVKESWESEGQIADQNAMTDGDGYKELALTEELRNRLANAGHWMIQFSHKDLDRFNVTDVVLVGDFTSDISNTEVENKAVKFFENGQLVILKNGIRFNALGVEVK